MRWMAAIGVAAMVLAAPVAAQTQGATVVGFASGSDELAPAGRGSLEAFITRYRTSGAGSVILAGHATLAESRQAILDEGPVTPAELTESAPGFAVGLSQRRANRVRDYLVAAGVPAGTITTQAFGASRPVDRAGKPSAADGRVEIIEGPGSGW